MCFTVCKFGGSSVADAAMFAQVRSILSAQPRRRYIVLSAPGKRSAQDEKITDLFIAAHNGVHGADYSILARIFARYASIRRNLCPSFPLELEFARIRSQLHSSLDYAASRGEYLCAKLFAGYCNLPFVDAADLLFFTESGAIDTEKSARAIQQKLLCHERAVIPGFYGANPDGSIRTFSRGGSDISGALIAALSGAGLYENWTDVNGLFTADPNIVQHPQRSCLVSFSQMERICAAGANLLHPDALAPLKGRNIDILLKNTFSPSSEGTHISESFTGSVRCVTGKRSQYMLLPGFSCDQSVPLLYDLPAENAAEVSAVNAFGLNDRQLDCIRTHVKAIHIIHMQDYIQIIIPKQQYETTIRLVHAILMNKKPGSI